MTTNVPVNPIGNPSPDSPVRVVEVTTINESLRQVETATQNTLEVMQKEWDTLIAFINMQVGEGEDGEPIDPDIGNYEPISPEMFQAGIILTHDFTEACADALRKIETIRGEMTRLGWLP